MAELRSIRAEARERAGKGPARAARRAGRVPGVLYGEKQPPQLISLDPRELGAEIHRPGFFARLIELEIDSKKHRALPRDVQLDPIHDLPVHVDFMRVGAKTRLTVAVPVAFENHANAPGLKRGGLLNIVTHDIELVCTADNIPERIMVALDDLDIGDSVHIKNVTLPPGTRPRVQGNFTVASIAAPTAVREEQAAAAAAAAAAKAAAEAAALAGEEATPEGGVPGAAPGAPGAPAAAGATGAAPGATGATPAAGATTPAAPAAPARGAPAPRGGRSERTDRR
jgi:large subunit ribosomal protein L25